MPVILNIYGDVIEIDGVPTDGEDYGQPTTSIPTSLEFNNLSQTVGNITVTIPYFQQAAQLVLFDKDNTSSYPNTMNSLRNNDNNLIANNSYNGLTEGAKALILAQAVASDLGFTL